TSFHSRSDIILLTTNLFPYTTLFRSKVQSDDSASLEKLEEELPGLEGSFKECEESLKKAEQQTQKAKEELNQEVPLIKNVRLLRSEEHTSELQSRENLVCRLLLEKKK